MPVEGSITLGDGFEFVVKINHNLSQRHIEEQFKSIAGNIFLLIKFPAFSEAQRHDRPDIGRLGNDRSPDIGFLDMVNFRQVRHAGRVMHLFHCSVFQEHAVADIGHGSNDIHIKLPVKPFLYYLHVQESEESAAEAKA